MYEVLKERKSKHLHETNDLYHGIPWNIYGVNIFSNELIKSVQPIFSCELVLTKFNFFIRVLHPVGMRAAGTERTPGRAVQWRNNWSHLSLIRHRSHIMSATEGGEEGVS